MIHVARSQNVKGPYSGDRTFYGSQSGIHGPGHMGVYSACGLERFTYHDYPESGGSVIGENELQWSGGWPEVGPQSTKPLVLCGSNSGGAGGSSGGPMGGASGSTAGSGSAGDSNSGGAPSGTPSAGSSGSIDVAGAPAAGGLSENGGTDASGGRTSTNSGGPSATAGSAASAGTSTIPAGGSSNSSEPPDTASGCSLGNGVKHERDGFLASLVGLALVVVARRRRS